MITTRANECISQVQIAGRMFGGALDGFSKRVRRLLVRSFELVRCAQPDQGLHAFRTVAAGASLTKGPTSFCIALLLQCDTAQVHIGIGRGRSKASEVREFRLCLLLPACPL